MGLNSPPGRSSILEVTHTHTHTLTHTHTYAQEMNPITFTWSMRRLSRTARSPFHTEWPFTDTLCTHVEAVVSSQGVAAQTWARVCFLCVSCSHIKTQTRTGMWTDRHQQTAWWSPNFSHYCCCVNKNLVFHCTCLGFCHADFVWCIDLSLFGEFLVFFIEV